MFAFDWDNPLTDTSGKYFPKEANTRRDVKCSSDTSSKVTSDEQQLQDSFSNTISASASGKYGGFSA